jgi:hypothetical protein
MEKYATDPGAMCSDSITDVERCKFDGGSDCDGLLGAWNSNGDPAHRYSYEW